jgi:MFS family permease
MGTLLRVSANFVSQAFAVILVVLQQDFQWSVTAIVMAQVFRSLVSAVLSPSAGWVGDRYGARRSLLVAASLYVGGMLLLSTMSQIWQLYIYYSLVLGLAQALFSVNIPTTVAAWFKKRLGVAVGIQ